MFIDQARIKVNAGDGGNGIVAFRREKYVPLGGPSGGDGGRGGDIVAQVDEGLRTLMDFRYNRHFKADRGTHGSGKNMHGAKGETKVLKVPPGTLIFDDKSGELIADLIDHGQEALIAKGGRGGRGNARFATSKNKAPSIAENGEPGEEKWIRLELKLIADVGLVGFPNAGKSTLISRLSAARPKIADYPFTTLTPNLGVVVTPDNDSYVIADIPGLIEGAHLGAGLGHEFLRHIERTRILVFILDAAETESRSVFRDYEILIEELTAYSIRLADRPRLIVANKMDLPDAEKNMQALKDTFGSQIVFISAVSGQGLGELKSRIITMRRELPPVHLNIDTPVIHRFEEENGFVVKKVDGIFEVSGPRIEKLVVMTKFNEEGLQRFQRIIEYMGVEEELRKLGIKVGDTVKILDLEFDYS